MIDEQSIVEAVVEELAREFGCTLLRRSPSDDRGRPGGARRAPRGGSGERLLKLGWRQPASLGLIGRVPA